MSLIKKEFLKNAGVFLAGCVLALLILEIFLRFYNPFGFRVRGSKIILYPYKKYVIKNTRIKGADPLIIHTKNSLGFRGEEPPSDLKSRFSIIAVGGSTTECFYLSDGKSWPEVLGKNLKSRFPLVWINNAGIDGQSTFGHLVLLREYLSKIKPDMAVFYAGANDLGLMEMNRYDRDMATMDSGDFIKHARNILASKSEVFSATLNFYLYFSSKRSGLVHADLDLKTAPRKEVSQAERKKILEETSIAVEGYGKRLEEIIKECRGFGIEPVFVTQAMLCSDSKDSVTGLPLGKIAVNNSFQNCSVYSDAMKIYNEKMKETAVEKGVFLIDAASSMPADSSLYYDIMHFTSKGAGKFAEVMTAGLSPHLKKEYNGR